VRAVAAIAVAAVVVDALGKMATDRQRIQDV